MFLPAVLQGPFRLPGLSAQTFIAPGAELVKVQCQAGVIGSIPALNARPSSQLDDWWHDIAESKATCSAEQPDSMVAPFSVNQIVHRSNQRLKQDLETIIKHKVPILITSRGARPEVNEAVHSYGGIVLHAVIHNQFAHKAIKSGIHGLIAVAAGTDMAYIGSAFLTSQPISSPGIGRGSWTVRLLTWYIAIISPGFTATICVAASQQLA